MKRTHVYVLAGTVGGVALMSMMAIVVCVVMIASAVGYQALDEVRTDRLERQLERRYLGVEIDEGMLEMLGPQQSGLNGIEPWTIEDANATFGRYGGRVGTAGSTR